jgi:predicted RNA-binding protein YlxR (DUF448 family)
LPAAVHVPYRTCIGCRRRRPSAELVRVVLAADGQPSLGRGAGRGAWLCGHQCLTQAARRNGFERAWRRPVAAATIDEVGELLSSAMQDAAYPGTLSGGVTNERRLTTKG